MGLAAYRFRDEILIAATVGIDRISKSFEFTLGDTAVSSEGPDKLDEVPLPLAIGSLLHTIKHLAAGRTRDFRTTSSTSCSVSVFFGASTFAFLLRRGARGRSVEADVASRGPCSGMGLFEPRASMAFFVCFTESSRTFLGSIFI